MTGQAPEDRRVKDWAERTTSPRFQKSICVVLLAFAMVSGAFASYFYSQFLHEPGPGSLTTSYFYSQLLHEPWVFDDVRYDFLLSLAATCVFGFGSFAFYPFSWMQGRTLALVCSSYLKKLPHVLLIPFSIFTSLFWLVCLQNYLYSTSGLFEINLGSFVFVCQGVVEFVRIPFIYSGWLWVGDIAGFAFVCSLACFFAFASFRYGLKRSVLSTGLLASMLVTAFEVGVYFLLNYTWESPVTTVQLRYGFPLITNAQFLVLGLIAVGVFTALWVMASRKNECRA